MSNPQRRAETEEKPPVVSRDSSKDVDRADTSTRGDEREEDGLVYSTEDRIRMLTNDWMETALPTPPKKPGVHYCWLSTTNTHDSIQRRVRMGYKPVAASEIPGFESMSARGGQFDGCISVNEMVLFWIPEDLYQAFMMEVHHNKPNAEQERLAASAQNISDDKHGKLGLSVEGIYDDHRPVSRRPVFN